jgi:pSer/pThr/pTyr-binding forkhead associated (FHA) protein
VWILRTDAEGDESLTFRLRVGGVKTIGRAPRADFVVDAAMVSRVHCRLTAGREQIDLEDLESTNGTFVNGRRVERAALKEGDRLRVGRMELLVERRDR